MSNAWQQSGHDVAPSVIVGTNMEDRMRCVTEYAATVYEVNKRTLDLVIVDMLTGSPPASLENQIHRYIGRARTRLRGPDLPALGA